MGQYCISGQWDSNYSAFADSHLMHIPATAVSCGERNAFDCYLKLENGERIAMSDPLIVYLSESAHS